MRLMKGKYLRYVDLAVEAEQRGWKPDVCLVQAGCSGFIMRLTMSLFGELGVGCMFYQ